jgi:hypothetical protein
MRRRKQVLGVMWAGVALANRERLHYLPKGRRSGQDIQDSQEVTVRRIGVTYPSDKESTGSLLATRARDE